MKYLSYLFLLLSTIASAQSEKRIDVDVDYHVIYQVPSKKSGQIDVNLFLDKEGTVIYSNDSLTVSGIVSFINKQREPNDPWEEAATDYQGIDPASIKKALIDYNSEAVYLESLVESNTTITKVDFSELSENPSGGNDLVIKVDDTDKSHQYYDMDYPVYALGPEGDESLFMSVAPEFPLDVTSIFRGLLNVAQPQSQSVIEDLPNGMLLVLKSENEVMCSLKEIKKVALQISVEEKFKITQ